MNKIPLPMYDDDLALKELAVTKKVKSYPRLKRASANILSGYADYRNACGNVFVVQPVKVTKILSENLSDHYDSPPNALKHISELRASTEHLTCPMCGSLHRGTLDHLLPRKKFGAFAVFTPNLVPACKCNSKRSEILIGQHPGERILHPYYDDCLSERLIEAEFEDLGPVPRVGLRLCVGAAHPDRAAIAFHIRSIVAKTAVTSFLRDKWIDLCRKPTLVIRALKDDPASLQDFLSILEEELDILDDSHRSKNNWNSIFVSGLMNQEVATWLFHQMHRPGRGPGDPIL